MGEIDFEGSLILEKLAEADKVDEFYAAIDSDDFSRVKALLGQAGVDAATIAFVLQKMSDGDSDG